MIKLPTLNDFFCGTGGIGLGFKRAGWTIAQAWDFDKYAVQSYRANVGEHVQQADIREQKGHQIEKANAWSFGFPCTDLSIANMNGKNREKLEGANSGLFYEVMRLLDEVPEDGKPEILVAENVPDLIDVMEILRMEFAERGYKLHYQLFNSKYWGVAQHRERYFVIGTRIDKDFVFPRELQYMIPPLKHFLDDEVEEKFYYSDDIVNEVYTAHEGIRRPGELQQIGTLNMPGWLDYMKRIYHTDGLSPTLHTCQGGHRQAKILDPNNERIRRLTPTEYGRLQGFNMESYKIIVSNSQLYKQFGNAVTVYLSEAIANSIKEHLK